MPAMGRSPEGVTVIGVGPMIAIVLVGVLMSVVVSLSGMRTESPSDAGSGTIVLVRASESVGHIAPAIAGAAFDGTIDA